VEDMKLALFLREVTFLEVLCITSLNILAEVQKFLKPGIFSTCGSQLVLLLSEMKEKLMYSKT
jgi:hypothetical protein